MLPTNLFSKALFRILPALVVCALVPGCVSSGPKTQYYSIFPAEQSADNAPGTEKSFGVGPISLPEYIHRPGIVSLTGTNQVTVSGYNAWAGDLAENLSRVVAANLASRLGAANVSAFPWDNRVRPDYQVNLRFQEFAGVRGGTVKLKAKWILLGKNGSKVIATGFEDLQEQAQSESYSDYVAALNQLVNRMSGNIASEIEVKLDDR